MIILPRILLYDYGKASDPPTGYTSDVDAILASGTGICLDYAAVMASMLRSQRIPTRLEVGYAQDAYHAWISVYTADTGWLNGIIEFDGNVWTLVDPTFGANTDDKTLKSSSVTAVIISCRKCISEREQNAMKTTEKNYFLMKRSLLLQSGCHAVSGRHSARGGHGHPAK